MGIAPPKQPAVAPSKPKVKPLATSEVKPEVKSEAKSSKPPVNTSSSKQNKSTANDKKEAAIDVDTNKEPGDSSDDNKTNLLPMIRKKQLLMLILTKSQGIPLMITK